MAPTSHQSARHIEDVDYIAKTHETFWYESIALVERRGIGSSRVPCRVRVCQFVLGA